MTTRLSALLLIAVVNTAGAQVLAPTYLVEKFNVGGVGGTDYLTAEPGTGRVFVSRQTHVMVVDGNTGKVIGDIPDTPRVHGIALSLKWNHGFTTNAGDSTVTMFDVEKLAPIKKIKIKSGGLDGITYDPIDDRIVLTNHSKPTGTLTFIDPKDGVVIGTVKLSSASPEGATFDDVGRVYVANEGNSTIQVIDVKKLRVLHSWPTAPCVSPTAVALDLRSSRLFVACPKRSVVFDANAGKVVGSFENGDGVDGLAWDAGDHLMYVPSGKSGNIAVIRMMSLSSYKQVSTIKTVPGAKAIAHDPATRIVYQFQPDATGAWFVKVSH